MGLPWLSHGELSSELMSLLEFDTLFPGALTNVPADSEPCSDERPASKRLAKPRWQEGQPARPGWGLVAPRLQQ